MSLEEHVLAVLEVIANQQCGHAQALGLYLAGAYRPHVEHDPAAPGTTHDGQEGA
jgi:hypothetical protein